MTEDKLTLEDCYKYPKARIFKSESFSYSNIYDFIYHTWESQYSKFVITNCKLILRDISQLTGEEKKYIFRNYLINVEFQYVQWDSFNHLSMYAVDVDVDLNYTGELIDYLRKKNIMIEKPDWFEIGKAVKE